MPCRQPDLASVKNCKEVLILEGGVHQSAAKACRMREEEALMREMSEAEVRRLQAGNAELRLLLDKHQCDSFRSSPAGHVPSAQVRRLRSTVDTVPGCAIAKALAEPK